MIQVENNDLMRGGQKIGYIENDHICDYDGNKIGYFMENKIYNSAGNQLGYIEGEYLQIVGTKQGVRLEDNQKEVVGGEISDVCRAAVKLLLG